MTKEQKVFDLNIVPGIPGVKHCYRESEFSKKKNKLIREKIKKLHIDI